MHLDPRKLSCSTRASSRISCVIHCNCTEVLPCSIDLMDIGLRTAPKRPSAYASAHTLRHGHCDACEDHQTQASAESAYWHNSNFFDAWTGLAGLDWCNGLVFIVNTGQALRPCRAASLCNINLTTNLSPLQHEKAHITVCFARPDFILWPRIGRA